jgi:hypothetical protein
MLEMTDDGKETSVELMADDSAEKADEAVSVLDGSREEGFREDAEMVEETSSEMVELASTLLGAAVLRTSELKTEEGTSEEASVLLGSAELRTSEEGSILLDSAELAAEEGSSDDEMASVLLASEMTEEGALDGTALEGSAEETMSEEVGAAEETTDEGAAEETADEGAAEEVDAMTVDVAPEPGMSSYMSRRPPAPQNCCYEDVSSCHQGVNPFRKGHSQRCPCTACCTERCR